MKYKLEYIKSNDRYYHPVDIESKIVPEQISYDDVCFINKLQDGCYEIEYYDRFLCKNKYFGENQTPNAKIILYPSGIEEVKYVQENNSNK